MTRQNTPAENLRIRDTTRASIFAAHQDALTRAIADNNANAARNIAARMSRYAPREIRQ